MAGETNLARLLREMRPEVKGRDWGYAVAPVIPPGLTPFAVLAEEEGLTLVAPLADLRAAGLEAEGPMARITLTVHSSLHAVGLSAAVCGALARAGISGNVLAGFYHDHIFLAAGDVDRAMAALEQLQNA